MPLIDAYRNGDRIIVWHKDTKNTRRVVDYTHTVYVDIQGASYLTRPYRIVKKRTPTKHLRVCAVPIHDIGSYESWLYDFERRTRYRIPLYNADIKPEQMYLYEQGIVPFDGPVHLTHMHITIHTDWDVRAYPAARITAVTLNDTTIHGSEHEILRALTARMRNDDPDVLIITDAYRMLPYLEERMREHHIEPASHRWDAYPLIYRGGKTYYSYGRVRFQDHPIRLRGRLLIDTSSAMGSLDVEAIIELSHLSGQRFQDIAARSHGAVFQFALVKTLVEDGCIVPYKEKPIDRPMTLLEMVKADRVGHTFDAKIGLHTNVAEVDFSSLFPHIMRARNISAEQILCDTPPYTYAPGIPVRISQHREGYVARAISPFIERRMHYKKNPTRQNLIRAAGLKWVLVSSYGYLRFREFKLGIPSSHMAIGAYARELLLTTAKIAEQQGFRIVHGIIDSLYITKEDMTREDALAFCDAIEKETGMPVSLEGIFSWIVFLPSVRDSERPLPARYYGRFAHGAFKARGIEMRQRSSPRIVGCFQRAALEHIGEHTDTQKICMLLRRLIAQIPALPASALAQTIVLQKTRYQRNCLQRRLTGMMRRRGHALAPGMSVSFVMTQRGPVHRDDYRENADRAYYEKLLVRAAHTLLSAFGIDEEEIRRRIHGSRQTALHDFSIAIDHTYLPAQGGRRRGLAERQVRKRLERMGWEVWRGSGLLGIHVTYPRVVRKYLRLRRLIESHRPGILRSLNHMAGMPDFVCVRNGTFLFVECKLAYERLSDVQKARMHELQRLGFRVEVHVVVDAPTKLRQARVNIMSGAKDIGERQLTIARASRSPRAGRSRAQSKGRQGA